ncbi:MAG: glycosyltransferase [Ferruginibacter sp.]
MRMEKDGISVIICCFNSSSRIEPTLRHLYLQQHIPIEKWEVILVDNASSDDTAAKAVVTWNSFSGIKPPIKIVNEDKQGLSFARHRGIQESNFKFVLFCDDDNWLNENYLADSLNIMSAQPQIGALGGKGSTVFEIAVPPHFWKNQDHVLAVGKQWKTAGDITMERGVLYGAGMVLNKTAYNILLEKYDFSFQVSDRIGENLASSGDHELCLALKRIGYKIFYSEDLKFEHYIPQKRTTIPYYKQLFLSFGKSDTMLMTYSLNRENYHGIKVDYRYRCLRHAKNIAKSWLRLLFTGYYTNPDKHKYIDVLHSLYGNIGSLKMTLLMKNSFKETFDKNQLFQI